jgi:hypothetical protein
MTWRLTHLARIGSGAILAVLGLTLAMTTGVLERGIDTVLRAGGINSVDGARRSLVYRLDEERPTQFTFSGERDLIRLLSSVAIKENAPLAEQGWIYGYRVGFLDGSGSLIEQRDVYSRGVLPEMTEDTEPFRFLRVSNERIAIQNELIVDTPDETSAIQVTALDTDANVIGIDIRVYERQPLSESGALVAFLRRSPAEQRKLIAGSAFPTDTLSEAEMIAVARNSWRPVGPSGIAGEAYQLVVMYEIEVEEEEGEVVAAP